MKLTEKDKKLLLILAIVAILCLPYFFVIQPLLDKNGQLVKDISELQSEVNYQKQLALRETEYEEKAQQMADKSSQILARFPSDLPQEVSILFMHNTEQVIPLSLYQVSFGDDVAAQLTSDADAEQIDAAEAEMGDQTDDAVIQDNTQETKLAGGLTAMQTETKLAFDAGYQQFKDFLKFILDYNDRMVITELEASYSAEMDKVDGSFTLAQYALKADSRNPVSVLEPNMTQGTTNVFKQASGSFDESMNEEDAADFFILLNQAEADVDSLVIGQSNDVTEASYFVSSKNAKQAVTVTFTGELGEYNANYKIGKSSYSKEGINFTKEGNIILQIISSQRLGDDDAVAIDLNLVNNTDTILDVKLQNDDAEDPRVNIKGKTGNIIVE